MNGVVEIEYQDLEDGRRWVRNACSFALEIKRAATDSLEAVPPAATAVLEKGDVLQMPKAERVTP